MVIDAQPLPVGMTVMEAFRAFGHVPPMQGGAGDGAAAAPQAPAEGQGAGQGSGLYQEALQGVPPELHPYVENTLKKWDSQVTPKLQEAAQLRERFGALGEIEGLSDVPPQELQELLAFRQIAQNPDQLREWVGQVSQMLGIEQQGGNLSEQDWVSMGEQNGWFESGQPQPQEGQGLDPQQIAQRLDQLESALNPLQQFVGSQQQQQVVDQEMTALQERMASLEAEHGELDDQARGAIIELAHAYIGQEDPLAKGFERYMQITGGAEGRRVDQQLAQPQPALSGGRPDTSPPQTSWNGGVSPKDLARERFAGGRR